MDTKHPRYIAYTSVSSGSTPTNNGRIAGQIGGVSVALRGTVATVASGAVSTATASTEVVAKAAPSTEWIVAKWYVLLETFKGVVENIEWLWDKARAAGAYAFQAANAVLEHLHLPHW